MAFKNGWDNISKQVCTFEGGVHWKFEPWPSSSLWKVDLYLERSNFLRTLCISCQTWLQSECHQTILRICLQDHLPSSILSISVVHTTIYRCCSTVLLKINCHFFSNFPAYIQCFPNLYFLFYFFIFVRNTKKKCKTDFDYFIIYFLIGKMSCISWSSVAPGLGYIGKERMWTGDVFDLVSILAFFAGTRLAGTVPIEYCTHF